jgi:hypothetical protein
MVTTTTNYIRKVEPPAIPQATQDYVRAYQDQTNNVLRLFFNRLCGSLNAILGINGGSNIEFPYGAFQDTHYTTLNGGINNSVTTIVVVSTTGFATAGQIRIGSEVITYTGVTSTSFTGCTRGALGTTNAAHLTGVTVTKIQANGANTASAMYINTTDYSNGVTVAGPDNTKSKITVDYAGVYNLQWSGQFNNSDTALQDVSVWLRINGVDVTGSTGLVSVPNSHGGVDGHTIIGWNYFIELQADDYVEIWWSATSQQVTLECYGPATSPTRPSTASVIATLSFISALRGV